MRGAVGSIARSNKNRVISFRSVENSPDAPIRSDMNRQALAIILAGVAIAGGVAVFVLVRPAPEPRKAEAPAEPPRLPPRVLTGPAGVETPAATSNTPRVRSTPAAGPTSPDAPAPIAPGPAVPAPLVATLHFETDVPGAEVFIDRIFVGVTPVTAENVKPGSHRLNLSLPPYEPILETIEVAPGPRDIVIKYKEVRLDAKIDVVHNHRFGSCSGRLVATQHGLRYETTDKNDAFTTTLLDIETLQIDYLEKRLRVVVRGGKRFDFTDPAGDADRLFVFHRDVEKARERLKKGDQPAPE